MIIHADLHAHSAFAGGARAGGQNLAEQHKKIIRRFEDAAVYSPLKGVEIIGTGDIQFEPWLDFIEKGCMEVTDGIFEYSQNVPQTSFDIFDVHVYSKPKYMLQTELIFTGPVKDTNKKKQVHVLFLFPTISSVRELNQLLDTWGVLRKNMARPYVTCSSIGEVSSKMHKILDIDPFIEMIPAHVLTPTGVYGGNQRINFLEDFFGDAAYRLNAVETGLSADPFILGLIPELDTMTLISNADAHSAQLNRVGREFTSLEINELTYNSVINAIRKNGVIKTAEFHPTEGRYFLTGHREKRTKPGIHKKGQYCFFSPRNVPAGDICPQCKKELTIGVLQRATEISKIQGSDRKLGDGPKRNFVTMIPLVEIIAHALKLKTLTSKKVLKMYTEVLKITRTEVNLWLDNEVKSKLEQSDLPTNLVEEILMVKNGNFSFFPGGYDGVYGELNIGKTLDYENLEEIYN